MKNDKVTRRDFICTGAAPAPAGGMPCGKIGDLKISRLILGSNVPGAHSRDLLYVSELGRAYNTAERMLATYELAESQGINTLLQGNLSLLRRYNAEYGGSLRMIQPVQLKKEHSKENIRALLASAMKNELAAAFYIMGDRGDYLARAGRMDVVGNALEAGKALGILLGLGGHSLQVPLQCEASGITPDFYVKTFHDDNYWSATPMENREPFCWYDDKGGNSYSGKTGDPNRFHDNIWCLDAEKTREVMRKVKVPWIAFKVLAAGAIEPKHAFEFAFRGGADFIAVGMPDFYVRENAILVKRCVSRLINRDRPWRG